MKDPVIYALKHEGDEDEILRWFFIEKEAEVLKEWGNDEIPGYYVKPIPVSQLPWKIKREVDITLLDPATGYLGEWDEYRNELEKRKEEV